MVGFWRSAVLLLGLPVAFAENLVRVSGVDSLQLAAEALGSGTPVLFEKVDLEQVRRVVDMSGFVAMPDEDRDMLFMHKVVHPLTGNKIWRTRDLTSFEVTSTIYSEDGIQESVPLPPDTVSEESRIQFLEDAEQYSENCGSLKTVIEYAICEKYLAKWKLANDLPGDDQSGMMPSKHTSVWGQIDQITYKSSSAQGFQSMIPSTLWAYAVANAATLKLQNIVAYVTAPGIHSVQPKCNSGGCRSWFKREVKMKIGAKPTAAYNINTFHWMFSRPTTQNGGHTISTSFSESLDLGMDGNCSSDGQYVSFSAQYTWSNSYTQTVDIPDFSVEETTSGTVGSWDYFQTYPVNVHTYPFINWPQNWWQWYDPSYCKVVEGPPLARTAHQTNNAIKWYLAPALIDYTNKRLNLKYWVQVDAEVDGVWCYDWEGIPANPCNIDGNKHHCVNSRHMQSTPTWTVNILQSMNNLK